MSHTPGPWTVELLDSPSILEHCAGIYGADDSAIVKTDDGAYPPCLDDAYLIAAAPDLLAACKRALDEAGELRGATRRGEIRAAIAKAEGR